MTDPVITFEAIEPSPILSVGLVSVVETFTDTEGYYGHVLYRRYGPHCCVTYSWEPKGVYR